MSRPGNPGPSGPGGSQTLSPAANDVRHTLDELARAHPHVSAPGLVWLLARKYILAKLRRKYR